MTTLIAWVGVDSRSASSLYLAADSQFTWELPTRWLHGRKLYVARRSPTLLGYCGDVLFPSQTLSQAIDHMDAGLLCDVPDFPSRTLSLLAFLRAAMLTYPPPARKACSVLYAWRDSHKAFALAQLDYDGTDWSSTIYTLPATSDVVVALGSGATKLSGPKQLWAKSEAGGTSRVVFSAFCDHLSSGADPKTGGAPQLVSLYRDSGVVQAVGVVWDQQLYLAGAKVAIAPLAPSQPHVEWRDRLFQRCDPATGQALSGAQVHARPRALS